MIVVVVVVVVVLEVEGPRVSQVVGRQKFYLDFQQGRPKLPQCSPNAMKRLSLNNLIEFNSIL